MSSDTNSDRDRPDPQPGPAPGTPSRPRSRLVAPAAAVVAVAVVAAGSAVLLSHGGNGDRAGSPPVLHLMGQADTASALVEHAGAAVAPGSRPVVSGRLPTGPDSAQVRTLSSGRAPQSRVASLAHALGLTGDPVRQDSGWRVRNGDRLLSVSDAAGWRWTLSRVVRAVPLPMPKPPATSVPPATSQPPSGADPLPPDHTVPAPVDGGSTMSCMVIINGRRACAPTPVSPQGGRLAPGASIPEQPNGTTAEGSAGTVPGIGSGSTGSSSGSTGSTGSTGSAGNQGGTAVDPSGAVLDPDRPARSPAPAAVRSAARPVLTALGLSTATVTVSTLPGEGLLTADPVVGGLPTNGYSTVLRFDSAARLTFGTGWLAAARPGARYPLVGAGELIRHLPVATCDRCPAPERPLTITGARLGLALNTDDRGAALLVPAWFYRTSGSGPALVLVAVDPDFLAAPRGSSQGGGQPAQVEPAAPAGGAGVPAVPAEPAPQPTR